MALRSFWAIELVPGKEYTTTPDFDLHLTQAVLPASAKDKERTVVTVLCPEEEEGAPSTAFAIASLKTDVADSQHLDLVFDADMPITFTAVGKNPVHLTGYLVPDNEPGLGYSSDEFDEIDEDEEVSEGDEEEEGEVDEQEIRNQLNKRKALAAAPQNGAPAKKAKQEQPQQPQQPQKQKQPQQQQPQGGKPQTPKQNEGKKNQNNQQKSPAQQQKEEPKVLQGGLQITTLKEGTGKTAAKGNKVLVRYVGRFTKNGKVFDKAVEKPFPFKLGYREVISGWDLGVIGMKEGEKRKLVIPPALAYGSSGAPPTIPPNSSLTFEVELVSVR